DLMESSKNALERILTAVDNLKYLSEHAKVIKLTEEEAQKAEEAKKYEQEFDMAMDDDFNTADAIAAVFELVKFANTYAKEGSSKAFVELLQEKIEGLCKILGIVTEKKAELLDEEIEQLIAERQAARKAKNFARADEIRGLLSEKGILLEDTREGVKWKRA
ncbi:MAG: cysteine--tRNA ligase, partial [Lachnospiraceae bacterium]|nr:cysteine--tRNA ligase [Lachnospiraceae bacterium]